MWARGAAREHLLPHMGQPSPGIPSLSVAHEVVGISGPMELTLPLGQLNSELRDTASMLIR